MPPGGVVDQGATSGRTPRDAKPEQLIGTSTEKSGIP